jgi:DnaJ-domain-containing protein 1
MTDYFALLDQPRAGWVDPEQLKDAFHKRTLRAHPDASGKEDEFAQLNKAYQVLRDPKQRLQHLLALRGEATDSSAIPNDIAELFPLVASLTRQTEVVISKSRDASTALTRSLVRPELLQARGAVEEMIERIEQMLALANERLREKDADLRDLHARFSYLTRWLGELKEKHLQLSL